MKIGYYCESPADQAALAVFVEGILGYPPEPISFDLHAQSIPGMFSELETVIRGVYFRSDADGLIIVADADDTQQHALTHDQPNADVTDCRVCKLRKLVGDSMPFVRPMQGRAPLQFAIGVPVPAIEAWYLVGQNHQIGEAAWAAGHRPYTRKQLKKLVYGSDTPPREVAIQKGIEEARRIIADIGRIEREFPMGFGLMAAEIRSWRTPVAG